MSTDELSLQRWFTILEKHLDHFTQIVMKLVQGLAL
jgi:hypothetical protein